MESPADSSMLRPENHQPCSRKLLLLAALAGAVFFHAMLLPHQPLPLSALFPSASSSQPVALQGFTDARRWLESVHSREDLLLLASIIDSSAGASRNATTRREPRTPPPTNEAPVVVAKMLLQWSLALFLLRVRALSKQRAAALLALCALVLAGSLAAHASVSKLLEGLGLPADAADTRGHRLETAETAARLLNTLFVARCGASAAINAVLARGYQLYLSAPWPARWRRVPKYLGSKDLVVSTLFGTSALVALVSISAPALRALSEAATRIESLALGAAWLHLLFLHLGPHQQQ